jgi:tripartite-type tricarboxylate transporter receptor subunit TctC
MKKLIISAALLAAFAANAQTFPDKTLTIVVPFAAGGAADTTGRIYADSLSKILGKAVIVENVAGAGGAIGHARVKSATADGYTIGLGHSGTLAAAVTVNPKLPHNPKTDFDYIGIGASTPNIVFFKKDFPANTLQEFIKIAKERQDKLTMGHSGNGAASHITCLQFFSLIGVKPTYIAYRGFGQTINDILGGQIDGSCDLVASVSGQVQAGSVKAYAVAAKERSETVPTVPTAIEGGLPEFVSETWTGFFVPKGTQKAVTDVLQAALLKANDDPEVKKRLSLIGARLPRADERGSAAMFKIVSQDIDTWAEILKKAGFVPE